jgi:hypothetical protein
MNSPGSSVPRDATEVSPGRATSEAPRTRGLESLADFCRDPSIEPDIPMVPSVVAFYGTLLMVLGIFGAIASAVGTLILLIRPANASGQAELMPLLEGGFRVVVSLVYYRLGKGMRSGERLAVLVFCAMGVVAVIAVLLYVVLLDVPMEMRLIFPLVIGLIYLPPMVSAFRHWAAFH